MKRLILVTGPSRSGKSEWAEALARDCGPGVIYVATAQGDPMDAEWLARIKAHQQRRPSHWQTRHVPVHLVAEIVNGPANGCLLVDSLGTWLANILEQDEITWDATVQSLLQELARSPSIVILVAEETGWGVVPAYASGRLFRDRLGNLVRRIGAIADEVYLVTAGYAVNLKVLGTPVPSAHPRRHG